MTMERKVAKRALVINLIEEEAGLDGKAKLRARTYNNVKTDATEEAIHAVGKALSGLMAKQTQDIMVSEKAIMKQKME